MEDHSRDRSVFWPIVLIGVGVIWLLANFNLIPQLNFAALLRLWPLLLIAIGLDIIFGRRTPIVSLLIGLATLAVAAALVFAAPRLGLTGSSELKTERFTEPIDEAASAQVTLDLSEYPVTVNALSDSNNLIDAELTYTGRINFVASGESEKTVRLSHREGFGMPFFFDDVAGSGDWKIGLSPDVPIALTIDSSSGAAQLDLSQLQLTALTLDGSSGATDLILPTTGEHYNAEIQGGSGSFSVTIPEDAAVSLEIDSGSGSFDIDVPEDAAVRVEVQESGSGRVRVPSSFVEVRSGEDDEGLWETSGFEEAKRQIIITVTDLGSGSITVR
jgi:hypothetical protein